MIQETLKPSEIYKNNKLRFSTISSDLIGIYQDFTNKDKIIILLEYWFYNLDIIYNLFGKKGLENFFESDIKCPSIFAFHYEENVTIKPIKINQSDNRLIFNICKIFLRKKLLLIGADLKKTRRRIISKISNLYVSNLPLKKSHRMKKSILRCLSIYFKEIDIDGFEEKLGQKIPEAFYSNQINGYNKTSKVEIECSAACFLEFSGLENIFLLNVPFFIKGVQHGGGYDTFNIDYFVSYEKALCDVFIGWGLSEINTKQHKFIKSNKNISSSKLQKRLVWIEDSDLPSFYSILMPFHHFQTKNKETIKYIYEELKKIKIKYYSLPHPKSPSIKYNKYRGEILNKDNQLKGETSFKLNDIAIFDNSGATLLHYFVEYEMPFLHVIDKTDYDRFTIKQKGWFNILYQSELAFYNNENDKLSRALDKMLNTNYKLPDTIKSFHNKIFFVN